MSISIGLISRSVGGFIYLVTLIDYYFFLPKRAKMWELSTSPKDKKKLDRYRRAINVYKMHYGMAVLLSFFIIAVLYFVLYPTEFLR